MYNEIDFLTCKHKMIIDGFDILLKSINLLVFPSISNKLRNIKVTLFSLWYQLMTIINNLNGFLAKRTFDYFKKSVRIECTIRKK